MSGFIPLMVKRYLGSRRGFTRVVTAFSVLGILLGVAALVIVLAVMSGFRQELTGRILGVTGHATVELNGLTLPVARVLRQELMKIDGVQSADPYVVGEVMASADGRSNGAIVRGIDGVKVPDYIAKKLVFNDGSEALRDGGSVLMGDGLARNLGLLPGSGVTLLSPQGQRTMVGFVPRTTQLRVGGLFNIGMVQFDNGMILARIDDVQRFLRMGDLVTAVEVRVKNPLEIGTYVEKIRETTMRVTGAEIMDVRVNPWDASNRDFFNALQVERVTMFIILSLIVLVAAFNIITGQMMLVNDKLADIAILRTMGATRGQVMRIFFLNGMLLGGMGTAGGLLVGMVFVWNIQTLLNWLEAWFGVRLFPGDVYFLSELPARMNWNDTVSVLVMSLILTILASWYPAWRASRFNPVELLRRG